MSMRWWAVYRGGEYIEHVLAVSGERALDVVSERTGIPLDGLDAVDHGAMERSGLGILPLFSMEIGPEFSEPGPTMQAVPWSQTEARLEARRDPIPDGGPTDADLRGEVQHDA
jgi:hypothetical protein